MPTYEYTCRKCGESLEVFQSFSEKPLKKHADCGGELVKVQHAWGIFFKGSYFYVTDARDGNKCSSSSVSSIGSMTAETSAAPVADCRSPFPASAPCLSYRACSCSTGR